MFDPRRVREDDRDQVESDRLDIDARAARPGPRRPALRDLFDRVHRAFGRSMLLALARLHLDDTVRSPSVATMSTSASLGPVQLRASRR